jgi:WhiB family redox-sensing transcriptional regulator
VIGIAHVAGVAADDAPRGDDPRNDGEAWRSHARCNDGNGGLVDVFFSGELHDIARAKRLCMSCPALVPCLEGALERREPWGVWGGQLFLDGTIVATKRRRGRPPKVPRPTDQLPQVPLPEHLRAVPEAHEAGGADPSVRLDRDLPWPIRSLPPRQRSRRGFPGLAMSEPRRPA